MSFAALDRVLDTLPDTYAGPGGAVAVLKDGALLARRCWGWADVERRLPFTPETLFRVCSITKQFTCGTLLALFPDPAALDEDVRASMPLLADEAPRTLHLMHNQSGLRDYWALAMLCGAPVERAFGPAEARHLIGLTRTLQFAPGTRHSYCNQNFRILGDVAEARGGAPLETLMHRHVWDAAGMGTARLIPETETMPDGTLGYEGSVQAGFRPAVNRIIWGGDAALVASLDDMVAWEAHIDRTRDDPASLYNRLSTPTRFATGGEAHYGFGLSRFALFGRAATGHGGGLRGWSSFRCNLPGERLSVVVLFNHLSDARAAARDVAGGVLGEPAAAERPAADPAWAGTFEEPDTSLVVRTEAQPDGKVALWFAGFRPELLDPAPDGTASAGTTRLRRDGDGLWMDRAGDNQSSRLLPCAGPARPGLAGTFRCAELEADLTCVTSGGAIYGAFSGSLGPGIMQTLRPAGPDLWLMPCPRALDHAPPGDWTLKVLRDEDGSVAVIRVGCWLARNVQFRKVRT